MRRFCYIFCFLLITMNALAANELSPIVIVSSYNPDTKRMSEVIETLCQEFDEKGEKHPIYVENMNCRNLSECHLWKDRLWDMLKDYYTHGRQPFAIVLLGLEASSTYFSLDQKEIKRTPVLVGMRGENIVKLPDDSVDLQLWEPESLSLSSDFPDYNIIGGALYKYDVETTIDLALQLFPETDTLVFISDNTLGGVTFKAHFKDVVKDAVNLPVRFIDGRIMSFYDVNHAITTFSKKHIILIGTWRVDTSDSYFLSNTIMSLATANPKVPTFSFASVGMGHWAIGGYVPQYTPVGDKLASLLLQYENEQSPVPFHFAENKYQFDYNKLKAFGIEKRRLPRGRIILNEPISLWDKYKFLIICVVIIFISLLSILVILAYYLRLNQRLQEVLVVEKENALKASEMKSNFIANISHEIRTPLNAVVGFSHILADTTMELSPEERQEYAEYINQSSDTLLNLINDILDISRLDAKKLQFNYEEADLVQICKNAGAVGETIMPKKVVMKYNLPEQPVMVRTDVLRMQQVFNNLLSNARKYTEKGHVEIALRVINDGKTAEVSVSDTGAGIPKDKAEKIFARFEKLNEFKQGTGLGLSITRSLLDELGGRIWVDTNYTQGARFVFTHPILQPSSNTSNTSPLHNPKNPLPHPQNPAPRQPRPRPPRLRARVALL